MRIEFSQEDIQASVARVRASVEGRGLRYFVTTFGCQQNEADSERVRAMAQAMGYLPAARAEEASLIVVNTCAIRALAEKKALSLIGRYKAIKRQASETVIALIGCMAAEEHAVREIKEKFPYVAFTLSPNALSRFPSMVETALFEHRRAFFEGDAKGELLEGLSPVRTVRHRAWVSIMYGCNNFCSYCIVPYVRGRERSRAASDILAECRALVEGGCREITLLGQNVNSYRAQMSFAALLEAVVQLEGDFLVRFMTSHPKDVSDELIAVMARHRDKIAPAFHLPLQSGSDRILRAMNRAYTLDTYLQTVQRLRRAIPDVAITTDIIVGFPGEAEEDFSATLSVVREVGYDSLFSFIYSPREGTVAARMTERIAPEVTKERMERLIALSQDTALEKNRAYVGRTVRVLCDGAAREGGDAYVGRTDTGKLVRFTSPADPTGTFLAVTIDRATPYDLFGTAKV